METGRNSEKKLIGEMNDEDKRYMTEVVVLSVSVSLFVIGLILLIIMKLMNRARKRNKVMDEQVELDNLESAKRQLKPTSKKNFPELNLAIQSTEENMLPDTDRNNVLVSDTGASKEEHNI